MADTAKTVQTMVRNIEAKTGKSMEVLAGIIGKSGLTKHGEIRSMLMEKFGLGYGAANTVVHLTLKSDGGTSAVDRGLSDADVLAEIYADNKADLRPIHDKVLTLDGQARRVGGGAEEGIRQLSPEEAVRDGGAQDQCRGGDRIRGQEPAAARPPERDAAEQHVPVYDAGGLSRRGRRGRGGLAEGLLRRGGIANRRETAPKSFA